MIQTTPITICAVVGPTASGKSALAVELAQQNNGEVISFDSMQIYREAPIATAVPTEEERKGIPHHLLQFMSCSDTFSVAKYAELAHETIQEVHKRGHLPILVGGTGLYYSAVLDHLQFAPQTEAGLKIREQLKHRLETEGIDALYAELQQIDEQAAASIHINNHVRVLRALEIYYATGKTMTNQVAESRREPSPYSPCVIGLTYRDRSLLYDRINTRVETMIADGLTEEVKALYDKQPNGTILQAIGVKEFQPFFAGEISLAQVIERIQIESRHYAKRQLTWFRRDPRVQWLYRDDYCCETDLIEAAQDVYQTFLSGLAIG